uniref:Reverse transcriptase domain-containing protein n=1 Tax=Octopus bimaculoides TaxID=37653 RepID=A0A0L8I951_OCTBM
MTGFLFLMATDWVMQRTTERRTNGFRWNLMSTLKDLNFVDDMALLSSTYKCIYSKTHRLAENVDRISLKLNPEECKTLRNNARQQDCVRIGNNEVEDIEEFVYLGMTVKKDRGEREDIRKGISKVQRTFYNLTMVYGEAKV